MRTFTFAFLTLTLALCSLHASVRGTFGLGYRVDWQEYTISTPSISPVSKLKWSGIECAEAVGELEWICGRYRVGVEGALGQIFDGTFTDYDWAANGAVFLFSKTTSHVEGNTYDIDLKTGFDIWLGRRDCITFRPLIGVSYHNMYYKARDLFQHVGTAFAADFDFGQSHFAAFPIDALQVGWGGVSTHRSQWLTGWVGFDLLWQAMDELTCRLALRGHGGWYHSDGDWRLRNDLLPGESFVNTASAGGIETRLGGAYCIMPGTSVWLDLRYRYFETTIGNQRRNLASGGSYLVPFDGAWWSSFQAIVGIARCF